MDIYENFLKNFACRTSSHVFSLYEAGGTVAKLVALNQGPDLCGCLARMDGPRETYQRVVASSYLLTALRAALGTVDWKQVVTDMHGYHPKRLRRPAARAYVDPEPEDIDEVDDFVSLRLNEAANLPEVLLYMLHLSLRASCSGFFQPFQEPDLLPYLAGTDTNLWAVYTEALTALLEAHPGGLTASSPNAAYMADDILHVRGPTRTRHATMRLQHLQVLELVHICQVGRVLWYLGSQAPQHRHRHFLSTVIAEDQDASCLMVAHRACMQEVYCMAATVNTLDTAVGSTAAADFLEGCGKLVPVLTAHEARLPRWDRSDPSATALFVVRPPPPAAP